MAVVGSLVAKLSLDHMAFTGGLRHASHATTMFGRVSRGAAIGVNMLGAALLRVTGPIMGVYGAFRMMRASETFQQEMNSSLAIAKNMTPALRREMENLAKELAFQTKYSASELAKGYYYLFSAGLDANQALAALPVTAKFSQAAMADMAEATDILTDAMTALGLDSKDTTIYMQNLNGVADMIAETARNANATIVQFGQAVTNRAGTAMKNLNIPLSQGLAILGAFASQAKKGEDAGTAFDIVMRDMTDAARVNSEAFEKHGIRVFEGGMVRAIGMIEDLERRLAGVAPQQKLEILAELGIPKKSRAFTMMLVGMTDRMREWADANRTAGGTVAEIAEKQLPAFTKAWGKFKAVLEAFAIDKLTPYLQGLGQGAGLLLDISHNADAAADSLGKMGDKSQRIATNVVWGVGKMADAVHYLKIGWKFLQTAVYAAIDLIIQAIAKLADAMSKLPGMGAMQGPAEYLGRLAEAFDIMADEVAAEGIKLLDDFLPSQKLLMAQLQQEGEKYRRAAAKPWDTMAKTAGGVAAETAMAKVVKVEIQPPVLARAGSQEAYDLIRQLRNPQRAENIQQQQLVKTTEAVAVLERVADNTDATADRLAEIERLLDAEDIDL